MISEIKENTGASTLVGMYEAFRYRNMTEEIYNAIKGDTNSDTVFNIAVIVTLQNFLFGKGTIGINADMNDDGIVDIFDITLMKQHYSDVFLK